MSRGETDKGLSKQGQQNYDKIEWNSKRLYPTGFVDAFVYQAAKNEHFEVGDPVALDEDGRAHNLLATSDSVKDIMQEKLEAHDRGLHIAIDRDDKESDET